MDGESGREEKLRTVKYEILSTEHVLWALGHVLLSYLWMLLVLYKRSLKSWEKSWELLEYRVKLC